MSAPSTNPEDIRICERFPGLPSDRIPGGCGADEATPCLNLNHLRRPSMLFILALILLAIWGVALAFKVTFALIHVLLIGAVVLFVVGFFRGRLGGPGTRRTVT
jgi:hypothetical protein